MSDLVSCMVIATNIFIMLICWRNARRLTDGRRTLLMAVSAVMFGSALIYSSVESGLVTVQSLIDIPVLRLNVLILDIVTGALAIYVSRSTH